jgi:hypothetical protein
MAVLLALLVTTVFIIPAVIPYGVTLRLTNQAMLTLVLVSGVLAVADHRRLAIALAAISFGVVAIAWAESLVPTAMFPVLRDIVAVLAFLVLAFAVGINVFAPGHAIGDRVFGAVVLYLLLGLLWAVAYQVVESVVPGSFTQSPEHNAGLSGWFYFSFVTLTTVGAGDPRGEVAGHPRGAHRPALSGGDHRPARFAAGQFGVIVLDSLSSRAPQRP